MSSFCMKRKVQLSMKEKSSLSMKRKVQCQELRVAVAVGSQQPTSPSVLFVVMMRNEEWWWWWWWWWCWWWCWVGILWRMTIMLVASCTFDQPNIHFLFLLWSHHVDMWNLILDFDDGNSSKTMGFFSCAPLLLMQPDHYHWIFSHIDHWQRWFSQKKLSDCQHLCPSPNPSYMYDQLSTAKSNRIGSDFEKISKKCLYFSSFCISTICFSYYTVCPWISHFCCCLFYSATPIKILHIFFPLLPCNRSLLPP